MQNHDAYSTPFEGRYSSKEMLGIFSDNYKFRAWRKLWIALAEEEKALGINISDEQIEDMKNNADDIDYEYAKAKEKELRHDVMAHIHTFAHQAPKAAGLIHLGATSAFVGDNTDLLQIRDAIELTLKKLYNVILNLAEQAQRYKDTAALAFTHFQPAQPTSIGKRISLWTQDMLEDFYNLQHIRDNMKMRGVKGTTGTQASFLALFQGDKEKVFALDKNLAKRFGFKQSLSVCGQTYSRRFDSEVTKALALFAEDAHKIATDIRLLQAMKELEEPFEEKQVGSSAMAYKRNPMRSERICSLSRFIMSLSQSLGFTAATQWFERTLDDSANKRLSIPQSFLAVDAVLEIMLNVSRGFVVNEKVIENNLLRELPFMATENILMKAVSKGGNRQEVHERIRELSHKCSHEVKKEGKPNKLLDYLAEDESVGLNKGEIDEAAQVSNFIGLASEQTDNFVKDLIKPFEKRYSHFKDEGGGELKV